MPKVFGSPIDWDPLRIDLSTEAFAFSASLWPEESSPALALSAVPVSLEPLPFNGAALAGTLASVEAPRGALMGAGIVDDGASPFWAKDTAISSTAVFATAPDVWGEELASATLADPTDLHFAHYEQQEPASPYGSLLPLLTRLPYRASTAAALNRIVAEWLTRVVCLAWDLAWVVLHGLTRLHAIEAIARIRRGRLHLCVHKRVRERLCVFSGLEALYGLFATGRLPSVGRATQVARSFGRAPLTA